MQKIIPNLWFDDQAEEAARFYTSLFPDSRINNVAYYPDAGQEVHGQAAGSVLTVDFELSGYSFTALNGGPADFKLNPSISFHVKCRSKEDVDRLWASLSADGDILMPLDAYPFSQRYGWCSDKYGVSWQIILVEEAGMTQPIIPVLMFSGAVNGQAEEAINFYASVFKDGQAEVLARHESGEEPDTPGTVKYASLMLAGQEFGAMDSAQAHGFGFNEAVSLLINCDDQQEIDYFWEKLTDGGQEVQCGWLKDKYGVSWQVAPAGIDEMFSGDDKAGAERAMRAMLEMVKLDIDELKRAYEGK